MSRGPRRGGAAVLIGFMGAGKSSVGRLLAARLGAEFIDLDARIEASAGCSVREIFASQGEGVFRQMEREAIREAVAGPGRVIAAGGGAFLDPGNRALLKGYAPVILLSASPETVIRRLSLDESRPLLGDGDREEKVRELMARRRESYGEADFAVDTDGRTVRQVAERVAKLLGSRKGRRK
ncbi:MAG: shikimate kinase [Deltaproteobacteria bacterium]